MHVLGHSLGSALVAEILSNQPTTVPSVRTLPKEVSTARASDERLSRAPVTHRRALTHLSFILQALYSSNRFIFNVSSLFLVGSPLGLFFSLQQAQLIPRRVSYALPHYFERAAAHSTRLQSQGRLRTTDSALDVALDRAGRFGCLAVDSV